MIRRDYILRMIQEFMEALSRIAALKRGQKWQEATVVLDEEFNRLVGAGAPAIAKLSETELLARLTQDGPTQVVRHKVMLLTALLKEAGDVAATQDRVEESRECYLKGLHLLLEVVGANDVAEIPEFVPKIEEFVEALDDSPLPWRTRVLLMQHAERTGQWGRAEDLLYSLLDAQPGHPDALDFGIKFYERLRGQSDTALEAGNLPRAEIESALGDLRRRRAAVGVSTPNSG